MPRNAEVARLVSRTGHGASAKSQRDAVRAPSIVVLAVPGAVAGQVVPKLGDLSGKIILDPTNRVARETGRLERIRQPGRRRLQCRADSSRRPAAHVVKAFNTLNVRQMVDPETAGGPITIAIAGDDAAAKAKVVTLIKGMGLEPMDFGPLRYAHVLEEMLIVWGNARGHGTPFNYYLRPQPPQPAQR